MKCSISRFLYVLCIPLLSFSLTANCNVYKEISLEKKAQQSDTVLIGKVESISNRNCMELNSCADIRVIKILKGKNIDKVRVLFDGEVSEMNPLCCKVGKNYLFIIKRTGDYYMTVNGPYGIYELP